MSENVFTTEHIKLNSVGPFLPAFILFPLIFLPIPSQINSLRSVAGYFQAVAVVRLGTQSLFINTPVENLSSLHFHSMLSSPLVAIGYTEAGRLISLLAAVIAVAATVRLVQHWTDNETAFLSGTILWLISASNWRILVLNRRNE